MLRPTFESSTLKSLLAILPLLCGPVNPAIGQVLPINLWPDGLVHYRYCSDDPGCGADLELTGSEELLTGEKGDLRAMMTLWENALTAPDRNSGQLRRYVRFENCANHCTAPYVLVRHLIDDEDGVDEEDEEDGNMCSYRADNHEKLGGNPDGPTVLYFRKDPQQAPRIMLHELGHCLGLWHEFNRRDADRWLVETPDEDGLEFERSFGTRAGLIPVVGNYDYDSNHALRVRKAPWSPRFSGRSWQQVRQEPPGCRGVGTGQVAAAAVLRQRAISRVGVLHACPPRATGPGCPAQSLSGERHPGGRDTGDCPPSPGNFDLFARGSNNCIYWKMRRQVGNAPPAGSHLELDRLWLPL